MDAKNTLSPGTMLRQYRLEKVIGQGGFGITYLAYDTELQRNVAIKECYPRDFVSRDGTTVVPTGSDTKIDYDWAVEKFIAEATTLAKFRHPGIVQVLQILKGENNSAYMVLEYIEGQSLDQWLKSLPALPTQAQLEAVIEPMLNALSAVHKAEFTHRDIAPDNIFIRKNGEAVLLDFGAAKLTAAQHSKTMHQIVKNGYSAPEQYYEEGRQGPWTDIYAFSATLYRCLSGSKPVDAMARLDALHNEEPDPLQPLEEMGLEGYEPGFLAAIAAGLSPQARNRPHDVATWQRQLLGTRTDTTRAGPSRPAVSVPGSPPVGAAPAKRRNSGPRGKAGEIAAAPGGDHRRWLVTGAALAVLAAISGGAFWIYERQHDLAEGKAWAAASDLDTPSAYRQFARDFPESRYADATTSALAKLAAPWETTLGDGQAFAVATGTDTVIVAGETGATGELGRQAILYNMSLSGKVRWSKTFGAREDESFRSVGALPGGGIVVAGQSSAGTGGQGQGIVALFSAKGELEWSRQFGGPGTDRLLAVARLSNGNLVAVGSSMRIAGSRSQGWVLTLSARGELISERAFDAPGGGIFRAVAGTPGGGLLLAGNSGEDDTEQAKFWVVKLSSDGSVLFDRTFGGRAMDRINDIAAGADGNFVMVGETRSFGTNTNDGIVVRLTPDNKMPPKPLVHPGEDALKGVAVRDDGTILATGYTNSEPAERMSAWLLQLSADMRRIERQDTGSGSGEVRGQDIALLDDGSFVVAGAARQAGERDDVIWLKRVTQGN